MLIVEQGAIGTSYGGWLSDEIQRRFFDWLDQPVERVTGSEASPTISKVLERAAIAGAEEIVDGLRRIAKGLGSLAGGALTWLTCSACPRCWPAPPRPCCSPGPSRPATSFAAGDALAEIETDKALVELEAEESGIARPHAGDRRQKVTVGDAIAVLVESGDSDADIEAVAAGGAARRRRPRSPIELAQPIEPDPAASTTRARAVTVRAETAALRQPARAPADPRAGHRPGRRHGTGPGGRIVRRDLDAWLSPRRQSLAAPARQPTAATATSSTDSRTSRTPACGVPSPGA